MWDKDFIYGRIKHDILYARDEDSVPWYRFEIKEEHYDDCMDFVEKLEDEGFNCNVGPDFDNEKLYCWVVFY